MKCDLTLIQLNRLQQHSNESSYEKNQSTNTKENKMYTEVLRSTLESVCTQSKCRESTQFQLRTSSTGLKSDIIAIHVALPSNTYDRVGVSDMGGAAIA